jgi:hypothetical protein
MHIEPTTKSGSVVGQYKPRQTALARRRRLNRLVRELADDLGFERVTLAERAALSQLALLNLQIELMQAAIVRGEQVSGDELIRLTGAASRMLVSLRKRVRGRGDKATATPLRERWACEPAEAEA